MDINISISLFFSYLILQLFYTIRITDVTAVFVNVVFSVEDEILIKNLYLLNKATQLMNEFSNK